MHSASHPYDVGAIGGLATVVAGIALLEALDRPGELVVVPREIRPAHPAGPLGPLAMARRREQEIAGASLLDHRPARRATPSASTAPSRQKSSSSSGSSSPRLLRLSTRSVRNVRAWTHSSANPRAGAAKIFAAIALRRRR